MNPPLIAPTAVGKNRYAEIGRIRFRYALFEPTVAGTEGAAWAGRTDVARDVVLLHGFGGSLFSWRDLAEPLASDHRVLVFDRPGFGLTSRPLREEWMGDEDDPYTLEAAAAQTIGLMDHVGMRKAGLIAHSAGSAVAVAAAARYPERVTALVLEDPAVVCTRMAPNWLGPVLRSGPARRVGPKLTEWASAHTDERSLKRALHNPDLVTPEVMAGYREPMGDERWAPALWEYTTAPRAVEARDLLASLDVPMLVIAGHEDAIIPYRCSVDVARQVRGATMITYEDTGHVPHEERPERFLADVRAFLSDVRVA